MMYVFVQFSHLPFFFSVFDVLFLIYPKEKTYLTTLNTGFSNRAEVDQHELFFIII